MTRRGRRKRGKSRISRSCSSRKRRRGRSQRRRRTIIRSTMRIAR